MMATPWPSRLAWHALARLPWPADVAAALDMRRVYERGYERGLAATASRPRVSRARLASLIACRTQLATTTRLLVDMQTLTPAHPLAADLALVLAAAEAALAQARRTEQEPR